MGAFSQTSGGVGAVKAGSRLSSTRPALYMWRAALRSSCHAWPLAEEQDEHQAWKRL